MGTTQARISRLDALRGVAALMVLIGHCGGLPVLTPSDVPALAGLKALWDGESGVLIFFLLSGYVLALQLQSPHRPSYPAYLIRRFFRIWPAFAAALMLSFVVLRWLQIPVDAGSHVAPPAAPTAAHLSSNLLMIGNPYAIDPPVWSLYVEARLSIIFPLLLLLAQRLHFLLAVGLSAAISVGISRLVHWNLPELLHSMVEAGRYIVLFVIGAALARSGNPVAIAYGRLSIVAKSAALLIGVTCLAFKFYTPSSFPPAHIYISWVGVSLAFIFALYSKTAERLLNRRPLLVLGHLSYGLYLVHYPIMLLARSHVSQTWLVPIVLAASLSVACILHHVIEKPAITLGRRFSQR